MTDLFLTASYSALYVAVRAHQMALLQTPETEGLRSRGRNVNGSNIGGQISHESVAPWLVMFRWIMDRLLGRVPSRCDTHNGVPSLPIDSTLNREKRRREDHFKHKRPPASRLYIPLTLLPRGLTRAQWFAWDARLTGRNPVRVQRLAFRAPRRIREFLLAQFGSNGKITPRPAVKGGLTPAQLPPD